MLLVLLIACQRTPRMLPGYPVTPQVAVESTFKVEQYLDGILNGSGTAWIVDHDKSQTYLVTAGHVCDHSEKPMAFTMFKLIDRNDKETWARPLMYHSKHQVDEEGESDLCVLVALGNLGPALLLADELPEYGSWVTYVGAVMGQWGKGLAPVFDGRYSGWRVITAPTIGGASGAAIFTGEGVFGVLVAVDRRYHHMVWFVNLSELRDFLYVAGLKKFEPSQSLQDKLKKAEDTEREQTD